MDSLIGLVATMVDLCGPSTADEMALLLPEFSRTQIVSAMARATKQGKLSIQTHGKARGGVARGRSPCIFAPAPMTQWLGGPELEESLEKENWRPAVGFEGLYSVSDAGRIRSEARYVASHSGARRWHGGCILQPSPNKGGYLQIRLARDGGGVTVRVSSVVALAFLGPRGGGMQVAHGDGDKRNNRPSNLRYATALENAADKIRHGTQPRGERAGTAKLTAQQVQAIRADTRSRRAIAREYPVSDRQIGQIKALKSWAGQAEAR